MFSNICFEKSGKHAPTRDRSIVLAAKAEAALHRLVKHRLGVADSESEVLQIEIRIQQIVPALHEYRDHAKSDQEAGRRGCHPVD